MLEPDNILTEGIYWAGALFAAGLIVDLALLRGFLLQPPRMDSMCNGLKARPWTLRDAFPLFLLAAAVFAAGWLLGGGNEESASLSAAAFLYSMLVLHFPALLIVLAVMQRRRVSWRAAFGTPEPRRLRLVALGAVYCIGILPVVGIAKVACDLFMLHVLKTGPDLQPAILLLLQLAGSPSYVKVALVAGVGIVVPAIEELAFRGIGLPALVKHFGLAGGTILLSLLFAVMHGHIPSYLPLFVLSVGLCLAYAHTGSMLVPIAMHSVFNLISVALTVFVEVQSI